MQNKRCFTACAAIMLLLAAVGGCGLEGPVPTEKKGAEDRSGPAPASASGSDQNIKAISQAMQNYASTYINALPGAGTSTGDAKYGPSCSWRVKLLPFVEEMSLYKQYRMNEPWDSPNNLEVAKKMPKVYQSPGRPDDGKTCFMVFTGKGSTFDETKYPGGNVPLASMTDGTFNTILVVEAGSDKAVPWTKPEDLPFDPANPLAALGQVPEEGFLAAMADGSVHRIKVDNATLKALITPNGGEQIDIHKLPGVQ